MIVRWSEDMLHKLHAGLQAKEPVVRVAARIGVSEDTARKIGRVLGWLPQERGQPHPEKKERADG